jgi:hypothetical protein
MVVASSLRNDNWRNYPDPKTHTALGKTLTGAPESCNIGHGRAAISCSDYSFRTIIFEEPQLEMAAF